MDVCCFNRPVDDWSQTRVRWEAHAVLDILERCSTGEWLLVGSEALEFELSQSRNEVKLAYMQELYAIATHKLPLTNEVRERGLQLQQYGFSFFDSQHLAFVEIYEIDIFLTTDDKLLRRARKLDLEMHVENPLTWFTEIL
jgi:predicted nucleic acid-binding protein